MKIMLWLRELINGPHPSRDVIAEALQATDDLTIKVRSLRDQIRPYTLKDDPFDAMMKATESAREYRRNHH